MPEHQGQHGGFTTEYDNIEIIENWLTKSNIMNDVPEDLDNMSRCLKLQEEAGEAAAAYIGMIGQNPRKGFTHTEEDYVNELADVAVTALCAIQHITRRKERTALILRQKLDAIRSRTEA